ncbi:M10 family metallopeptidase C-terminal domain-containing protein [Rhizobium sp. ARZ01]|uniref:cadherin-like domain-containing protein n=1 Tax=Rhizobium sp. ARZ01 TaxID=2769313 RepID=UPI001785F53E|nr:cadherin-like domain-containing protein [Rhizobium sp. ARZ01]MBD9375096.1 M10 family metallopeptidase C-terminal domain-containing protein [Rhizobium sp. ARZ01]
MAAPTSINFDGLVDENSAVGTWQGGGWTVSFLNGTPIEAIYLNNNIPPISTAADQALFVVGDAPGVGSNAVSFAGTSHEAFSLQSLTILRYDADTDSMNPDIRVVGYRNGSPVAGATQDFSLPTDTPMTSMTVTFSGAAWGGIDEFRIVQQNDTRDFYFLIDDIVVGAAAVSAPPVISNLNGDSVSYWEGSSAVLIDAGGNATLTDPDSADFAGGSVRVSIVGSPTGQDVLGVRNQGTGAGQIGVAAGNAITYGGVQIGTYSGGTGSSDLVVTLNASATPAIVQALLRNLTYANNGDDPSTATRTIRVTVDDGDGGISVGADVSVAVTRVNDAPTLSATGTNLPFTENGSAVDLFSGVSVSTVEAGQLITQLTLMVSNVSNTAAEILQIGGTDVKLEAGNVVTAGGWTCNVILVGTTATLTLSHAGAGTAAVQSLLDGMTYQNTSEAPDAASRTVTITSIKDNGGTANGGVDTTALSITSTVQLVPTNDAPSVSVPGGITVTEDVATALAGISFHDIDVGNGAVTVTFAVASGGLSATGSSGVMVGGSTNSLTLTGTLADINGFIAAGKVAYGTAPNATSSVFLTISISDGQGGTATASVPINVTAVNDAPVNTVPALATVAENGSLVLSSANGNGISVGDVDISGGFIKITLAATNGTISLSGTTGLSFTTGDGAADATMTFTGTLAAVNAALDGLSFTPTAGYNGSATITVTTSDQGGTGTGGVLSDTDTIAIDVLPPNPVVRSVGVSASDGTYKIGDVITVTVTFSEAVFVTGTPTILLETGITDRLASYAGGSGSKTLTFSYMVQAGDRSADLDFASTVALSLNGSTIKDSGGDNAVLTLPTPGSPGSIGSGHNIVIDGAALNTAPVLTGDLKATVKEVASYKITTTDLYFSDPDDSPAGVRFTVSSQVAGKVLVNGTAATSFTGAELAAGKVAFLHDGSETTKASFKVFVEDGNEDKSTPVAQTFNFTVTPVNDAPKLGAKQVLTAIAEDASTASARKVADLSIVDPDGGNNRLSLVGADAKLFEIRNGALWLKKGAKLDFETNPSLDVTVRLDDPSIGTSYEASKALKITVKDVKEPVSGTYGNDRLTGTSGNDVLDGKVGNDVIKGGAGNDTLIGGTGVDVLTGGSGRDVFVFASVKDSAPGHSGFVNNGGFSPLSGAGKRDIVTDFVRGEDRLDVSKIDADLKVAGDQAFVWRGKGEFSGKAGELVFRTFDVKGTANDRTIVYGDINRDGRADFQIELAGLINLTKGDFIL